MNLYFWGIPILAAVILIISLVAKKMEIFLNFATRLCVGGLALYVTSEVMVRLAFEGQIGLNPATLTTVGLLGIPGYMLVVFVEVFSYCSLRSQ